MCRPVVRRGSSRPVGKRRSTSETQLKCRPRPTWMVGLIALLSLAVPPRVPGATGAQKCTEAKLKAFGAAVQAQAVCQAEGRKAGGELDATCLLKVEKKLARRFAKANKTGPCPGDAPGVTVATCVAAFDRAIEGVPSCAVRKLRAAGLKAAGKNVCASRAMRAGTAVDAACAQKVEEKFAAAIAKADARGSCTGTAAEVTALVDACLAGLPPPIPCTGGTGHPICGGTCAEGLTCRPYEVFANGASIETGCGCVDVTNGPECAGTTCGTDRHCADPSEVCERWMTGDPSACDHMICQPALTTPSTLPTSDKITECTGGTFPSCGGTCPDGARCQSIQAYAMGVGFFEGCICVDPRAPRCEMPTDCDIAVLPFAHCADPAKTCLVALIAGEDDKNPACSEAHCGDPLSLVVETTTSTLPGATSSTGAPTTLTTTSTTSTSTSSSTTTSTLPCVSTPSVSGCLEDLGNCTIRDNCIGLQWEKKQDVLGVHDVDNRYVWGGCCDDGCQTMCQPNAAAAATCMAMAEGGTDGCAAQCPSGGCYVERGGLAVTTIFEWINQINAENFAGHNDWRIPTDAGLNPTGTRELASIVQKPCAGVPCIDPIFGPTSPTGYWSRTTNASRSVDAWFDNFFDGSYGNLIKREALFVRAVR